MFNVECFDNSANRWRVVRAFPSRYWAELFIQNERAFRVSKYRVAAAA